MKMGFQAGVEYKGKIYFSDDSGFGLFSFDLSTRKVEFCVQFEETDCFALHRKAFLYKNEAWFVPQAGRHITCVNLDDYSIQRFEVPYKKMNPSLEVLLSDGVVINGMLVCCPYDIDTLVIADLNEHKLRTYFDFIDPEKESFISLGVRNDYVWLYPFKGEEIKVVDPNDGRWEIRKRYDRQFDYSEVAFMQEKSIYAPGGKRALLCVDDNEKRETAYDGGTRQFIGSAIKEDTVIFFPYEGKDFLEVDATNMQQRSFDADSEAVLNDGHILIRIDSREGLFLSSSLTGYVLEICEDGTVKCYHVVADEGDLRKQIDMKTSLEEKRKVFGLNSTYVYHEDYKRSLKGFVEFIGREEE